MTRGGKSIKTVAMAVLAAAALMIAPASAMAQGGMDMKMPAGVTMGKLANGSSTFADAKGMTLYTFTRDTVAGKSVCNGRCAENWPPLAAADDAKAVGDWTIVTRDDGKKMWAYKAKPLYTYARDAKAGDATGDGAANGAWKVAVP